MNSILLYIGFLLLLCSCHRELAEVPDNYPKDSTITSLSGRPWDSLEYYVPTTIHKDSQVVKLDISAWHLAYFSTGLYYAQEPILYNYYTGHDIYRFSLLRAFFAPIFFILHRDGDKVWLVTKGLDKRPNVEPWYEFVWNGPNIKKGKWVLQTHTERGDSMIKNAKGGYTCQANVIYNGYVQLTLKDWTHFEGLLKQCDFWNLPPITESDELVIDGERWLIEGHQRNTYWFVHTRRRKGAFHQAGEFLIQKSGVKSLPIFEQSP